MKIDINVISWLLDSNPWTEYNTRVEILQEKMEWEKVKKAKERLLQNQLVTKIKDEVQFWPGPALKRHNDAKHLTHKLVFLADIGLRKSDLNIANVAKKIFTDQTDYGAFQIIANIPTHFGGSGLDELAWMLCDSPTVLYALIKLSYEDNPRIEKATSYFVNLIRENGWPCAAAPKFGKFQGPGRKDDPCPYATLLMLKVLANQSKWRNDKAAKIGAEMLLTLWNQRKERKPFLFAMGSRFKKMKFPYIWYDIMHISEVLTKFDWLKKDERLLEMLEIIRTKADDNGLFKAESVWRAFKEWDFGQKREPSPWITFQAYRILNRVY